MKHLNVTIWDEFRHEKTVQEVKELYPDGIHAFIAQFLKKMDIDGTFDITLASLDEPNNGLPDEILNKTDVLLWWGHMAHHEVSDELVNKIRDRVYRGGMGFIALHSAHMSKPFQSIVGTNGILTWGDNQHEILWNTSPAHPIAAGIPEYIDIADEEMYGEPFYIPTPDATVFTSWYEHGNVFRSGCCFLRGLGRVFYFQPGHETCKSYYNKDIQRIIYNAVLWAAPSETTIKNPICDYVKPIV